MGIIARILESYGLLAVGFLIFFEDFGIPLPGETILIAASVTASQHKLNILLVVLVAFVAAVAGDNLGYLIGHYGGRRVLYAVGCRLQVRRHYLLAPSKLRKGEKFFQRRGSWLIIVARFFDVMRQVNGIIAGAMRVRWLLFLAFNIVGAALWVGVWASVGYFVGAAAGQAHIDRLLLYVFAVIIGLLILSYLARRLIRWIRHTPKDDVPPALEERICREERGD